MRIILLLCAALALTAAAVPAEEVPAAEEIHQVVPVEEVPAAEEIHQEDGELPVETEVGEVKLLGQGKSSSCPYGWNKFGSRCFNFISSALTWAQAESYCKRYRTNLASIHSQVEYDFVQLLVKGNTGQFPLAWLGGRNTVMDDLWLWTDGSYFLDWFWSYGEPNSYGSREKCVVMNYSDFHLLGAVRCQDARPFVCATRPM